MTRWIVRLQDGTTEYKEADYWKNERGMLVLYKETDDGDKVIIAYAAGTWRVIERRGY